jgi:hypothetical protein
MGTLEIARLVLGPGHDLAGPAGRARSVLDGTPTCAIPGSESGNPGELQRFESEPGVGLDKSLDAGTV